MIKMHRAKQKTIYNQPWQWLSVFGDQHVHFACDTAAVVQPCIQIVERVTAVFIPPCCNDMHMPKICID
jgi:hypothetical protein